MKAKTSEERAFKSRKKRKEEFAKYQYEVFENTAYSMAVFAVINLIWVWERLGRKPTYIKKMLYELFFNFDMPIPEGSGMERPEMTETIKMYEERYNIDFSKINIHMETEEEFIEDAKRKMNNVE